MKVATYKAFHSRVLVDRERLGSRNYPAAVYRNESLHTVNTLQTLDGRLSRTDAARYLGVASKTLSNWCLGGKGPRPVKVGGRVFYWVSDLANFVQQGAS